MGYGAAPPPPPHLYPPHTRKPSVIGKAEGTQRDWHGHVSAITVAPEYRRLSLARNMMDLLERVSDTVHKGYFVDLFARCNNYVAIRMYEGMGYSVWRRITDYYDASATGGKDDQDAFGELDCGPR